LRGLPPETGVVQDLPPVSGAGYMRDEKKPAVDYANAVNKRCRFAGI
jgi:hypothetical protein